VYIFGESETARYLPLKILKNKNGKRKIFVRFLELSVTHYTCTNGIGLGFEGLASAAALRCPLQTTAVVGSILLDWPFGSSRPASGKFNYCACMK
jgi:hypothetical protein